MNFKDLCIREWSPLEILEKIPTHLNKGLFSVDVKLTCVKACDDYLALASDVGVVFWFNRQTGTIQKLKAEVINSLKGEFFYESFQN